MEISAFYINFFKTAASVSGTCSNEKSAWETKCEQQHLKSFEDMNHMKGKA